MTAEPARSSRDETYDAGAGVTLPFALGRDKRRGAGASPCGFVDSTVVTPRPAIAYLDHAATTPVRPEARAAVLAALDEVGNPASPHAPGRAARRRMEVAREHLASALGAHPREVVFTSGGTEADNLIVKGVFWARRAADPRRTRILVSAVEHHAVLDPARWLAERQGATVVEVPVDAEGRLEVEALRAELAAHGDQVALVSVMWANNEVGTLQPLAAVVAAAAEHGVPVHADAVQAVGQVRVDFAASGLAALTVSGHKVGAPVGTGAVLARRDLPLTPLLHGGGQERGVRSGTPDAPSSVALAAAVTAAVAAQPEEAVRLAALRDALVAGILASVEGATLRGAPVGPDRLPGNAHVTIPGAPAEALLFLLDSVGIAASSGSACRAGVEQPSHVLLAMGADESLARNGLRLTLGHTSTIAEVRVLLDALPGAVERARRAGAVG